MAALEFILKKRAARKRTAYRIKKRSYPPPNAGPAPYAPYSPPVGTGTTPARPSSPGLLNPTGAWLK